MPARLYSDTFKSAITIPLKIDGTKLAVVTVAPKMIAPLNNKQQVTDRLVRRYYFDSEYWVVVLL